MQLIQGSMKSKKNSPMILSVLNTPHRSQLKQIASPSSDFSLFEYGPKKVLLAGNKISIPKTKLLPNLQIYEWRFNTLFPIVKTVFVAVKQNDVNSQQFIELTIFTEFCPFRLTQVYEMPMGQSLYILKESILGFERLFTRFGAFQILNSMITVNKKGLCRVWLNQNFALNSFPKRDVTESKMVSKILTIIQSHSQESKITKRLFQQLEKCSTFLSALKTIENFVKQNKIFVPTRFSSISSAKELPRYQVQTPKMLYSIQQIAIPTTRFSIKNERLNKINASIKDEVNRSFKDRKNSTSPFQIKRFKSEDLITGPEAMKISDGETAHTGKLNRTSNIQAHHVSPKSKGQRQNFSYSQKKQSRWMQQSSYVMGDEDTPNSKTLQLKAKKQLSYSQAFKPGQLSPLADSERKYSCKIYSNNSKPVPYFTKNNLTQAYTAQFSSILNGPQQKQMHSPFKQVQAEQKQILQQVSGNIIKSNGWIPSVSGLMDIPAQLEQSFHQGHEQTLVNKQIKLQKLGQMGRQQMHMSVLSEQLHGLL